MISLKEHLDLLYVSLPLLKKFRYGTCCESVRRKYLGIALNDFFKDIGYNISKDLVLKKPYEYYSKIRTMILDDKSLTDEEKISLISKMQ